jgi:hypothetical protein
MQMSRFGDNKRKGIATFSDASKSRCLSAREAAQQRWDEELAACLQDKEDIITSRHCERHGIVDDIVDFEMMEDEAVDEDRDDSTVASTPLLDFNIGDGTIVTTTTSCVWGKRRLLESVASRHPSHRHFSRKDQTALAEVEVMIVDNTYVSILCHLSHHPLVFHYSCRNKVFLKTVR